MWWPEYCLHHRRAWYRGLRTRVLLTGEEAQHMNMAKFASTEYSPPGRDRLVRDFESHRCRRHGIRGMPVGMFGFGSSARAAAAVVVSPAPGMHRPSQAVGH